MASTTTATFHGLGRERPDPGTLARLAARALTLSPAERCCLWSSVTAVFTGWGFYWTHRFVTNPEMVDYLHSRVWNGWWWYFHAGALIGFVLIAIAAGALRRTRRWLVFLFVQTYFVVFAISVCCYGAFTTDLFGAVGITGIAIGTVFFERRAVLLGPFFFTTIVLIGTGAQLTGVVPYAPLFTGGPIYDGVLSRVWVAAIGLPVLIGGLFGLVTTFLVISAWREQRCRNALLEAEISAARERRLSWLEHLSGFLRHELKNQLVGIESSIRLVDAMPRGDLPRYLARARTSVDTMRQLITAATEATDLESALRVESLEYVDLSALVRDRLEGFRDERRDCRIDASVAPGLWVRGSEARLIQVLDKLLANAAQHSRGQGSIHVSLSRQGGSAELAVANRGDPLPADVESLFEPFASTGRGPGSENLGTGLYVVRIVTEHLGGRVRASPLEDGPGAGFILSLPLTAADGS